MTEHTTILSRHGAEALLEIVKNALECADLEKKYGHANPTPRTDVEIGFLKLTESYIRNALTSPDTPFRFQPECSAFLCTEITAYLDCTSQGISEISDDEREYYFDTRAKLRDARFMGFPLYVAPKYDFILSAADVAVRVSFTEEELRKLARGTHECVVFTAVVPPDPTADS